MKNDARQDSQDSWNDQKGSQSSGQRGKAMPSGAQEGSGDRAKAILRKYVIGAVCVFAVCCAFVFGTMYGLTAAENGQLPPETLSTAEASPEAAPASPPETAAPSEPAAEPPSPSPTPEEAFGLSEYIFTGDLGFSFMFPMGFVEEDISVDGGYGYLLTNSQYQMQIQILEIPFAALSRTAEPSDVFEREYRDELSLYDEVTDTWKNNSWSDLSWRKSSYDLTGYADEETIFYTRLYNRGDEIFTRVRFSYPKAENAACDFIVEDFLASVLYDASPSPLDIRDLNTFTGHSDDYVEYPYPRDYLDAYETMHSTRGVNYYRMARTDEKYKTGTIPNGTEVTVLAVRGSRAFVVFVADNSYEFGWCYYPYLSY